MRVEFTPPPYWDRVDLGPVTLTACGTCGALVVPGDQEGHTEHHRRVLDALVSVQDQITALRARVLAVENGWIPR